MRSCALILLFFLSFNLVAGEESNNREFGSYPTKINKKSCPIKLPSMRGIVRNSYLILGTACLILMDPVGVIAKTTTDIGHRIVLECQCDRFEPTGLGCLEQTCISVDNYHGKKLIFEGHCDRFNPTGTGCLDSTLIGVDEFYCKPTCFSKDSKVAIYLADRKITKKINIDQLQVGDLVEVAANNFSPVVSWAHFEEDIEAEFLQIITSNNNLLEISGRHHIYVGVDNNRDKLVFAKDVKVGDKIFIDNSIGVVTKINKISKKGVYAPITKQGDILINGVRAGCYSDISPYFVIPIKYCFRIREAFKSWYPANTTKKKVHDASDLEKYCVKKVKLYCPWLFN